MTNGLEKRPVCDIGSFHKLFTNPTFVMTTSSRRVSEQEEVVVVGAGRHRGPGTNRFLLDATKRILFFSYRNCFSPLPNGTTTDSHWGCLIRTSQMMLAQAYLRHYGDQTSLVSPSKLEELKQEVLPLFMDRPSAPFSIHQIELHAHEQGIPFAAMLTPTQSCIAFSSACRQFYDRGGRTPFPFCCEGRSIVSSQVLKVLRGMESALLFIPVVMGLTRLSERYENIFLRLLDMDSCCGIAGGYEKASFYVFGRQGKTLFYMNPHYIQPAYVSKKSLGRIVAPRGTTTTAKVDTCAFLTFYIKDEAAFDHFREELAEVNAFVLFPLIAVPEDETEPARPGAISDIQSQSTASSISSPSVRGGDAE